MSAFYVGHHVWGIAHEVLRATHCTRHIIRILTIKIANAALSTKNTARRKGLIEDTPILNSLAAQAQMNSARYGKVAR